MLQTIRATVQCTQEFKSNLLHNIYYLEIKLFVDGKNYILKFIVKIELHF
jgi:hypothetical protein